MNPILYQCLEYNVPKDEYKNNSTGYGTFQYKKYYGSWFVQ